MRIERAQTAAELADLKPVWRELSASHPFCGPEWLTSWWAAHQARRELCLAVARNADGEVVGLAPWQLRRHAAWGRVLGFLGSGEACSDYLRVLCKPGREAEVGQSLATWLTQDPTAPRWDEIELEGLAAGDTATEQLLGELETHGASVRRTRGEYCWRLQLDGAWEDYLQRLSKSHRKQVRRVERRLIDSGRAELKWAQNPAELDRGWEILVDLHQKRRASLGQPGCFASRRFGEFLRGVSNELLPAGELGLYWVELDGEPVAAEWHWERRGVSYAYQAGVDPARLDDEPGRLINILTLKRAIERGFTAFDFLRGDEPYKAHWRAEPQVSHKVTVTPNRTLPRLRQGLRQAAREVKAWLRRRREPTPA